MVSTDGIINSFGSGSPIEASAILPWGLVEARLARLDVQRGLEGDDHHLVEGPLAFV